MKSLWNQAEKLAVARDRSREKREQARALKEMRQFELENAHAFNLLDAQAQERRAGRSTPAASKTPCP